MVSSVDKEAAFFFIRVTWDEISKEIKRLDIPTKVIKQFPILIVDFSNKNISYCLTKVPSLMILKGSGSSNS